MTAGETLTVFGVLAVGEHFRMPADPDYALLRKCATMRYEVLSAAVSDAVGLTFDCGTSTQVYRVRDPSK